MIPDVAKSGKWYVIDGTLGNPLMIYYASLFSSIVEWVLFRTNTRGDE